MNDSSPHVKLRLVISDVDGTLLDGSAQVTQATRDAVDNLRRAGIRFTIASARPPLGTTRLREMLRITEPIAALNGALIISGIDILAETLIAPPDVHTIAETILTAKFDMWAFVGDRWYVTDLDGYRVAEHSRDTGIIPTLMPPLNENEIDRHTAKLVGVSQNTDAIIACQRKLESMRLAISATRSKPFYLDITQAGANKGNAVAEISRLTGIPLDHVATLGDMPTDMLMFRRSAISVAMGNAPDEVKSAATFVTAPNTEDGFAQAVARLIAMTTQTAA
jgi:Cof subfamily protein (haloacid dehalogenase superfamily)